MPIRSTCLTQERGILESIGVGSEGDGIEQGREHLFCSVVIPEHGQVLVISSDWAIVTEYMIRKEEVYCTAIYRLGDFLGRQV